MKYKEPTRAGLPEMKNAKSTNGEFNSNQSKR